MKLRLATLLLTCFVTAGAFAQTAMPTEQQRSEAKAELDEGARDYKGGRFVEARQHFERALALDPTQKNAPFFIARAIQAQFRPGDQSLPNIAIAREAIAAYQRVLADDPNNELAYSSIAYLYGAIGEDALQRDWVMRRATDEHAPADKRAQAYTVLASKEWNCSYTITESSQNKRVVAQQGKNALQYLKPKEPSDFEQARQCATRGLALVEQAISLDQESDQAWSYKTNLLLELAKLAEMDGNDALATDYRQQAGEAQKRTAEVTERGRAKREAEEKRYKEKVSPPF